LLEKLSVGGHDAVTFIHLALAEFTSGRFVATLDDKRLKGWLSGVRRQPKWRETILLAAGSGAVNPIVKNLLFLDNPEDPASTEVLLAADAYIEAAIANKGLIRLITKHLIRFFLISSG
jgi:hypothetical protein